MRRFLVPTIVIVMTIVSGIVIGHEIVDYIQYQRVLRVKEALIAL